MIYDYLIVGAGLSGSILAERIATQLDKKVLVIDKRNHIGGNCFDYIDDNGIMVHKYGPHAFHTNTKKVWDYLSGFTDWELYFHHVLAVVEGKKVPVPFNFNSINILFPSKLASKLEELLIKQYGFGVKIPILKLKETKNEELKFLADYIYKNVFYGYTVKQWGLKPEELDSSVTSRVPVFLSRDNRYFQDNYQGIPSLGYTAMFNKILNHKNINIELSTEYFDAIKSIKYKKLIYTGEIDRFFDNIHGKLPYRSLKFDLKTYNRPFFQETAQVNYPNNFDYTRITEFRHFLHNKTSLKQVGNRPTGHGKNFIGGEKQSELTKTTIAYEYPMAYDRGKNEPYYPIPMKENEEVFLKYKKEAEKLAGKVYFTGRLADYKYYNMDQIAGVSLMFFEKMLAKG